MSEESPRITVRMESKEQEQWIIEQAKKAGVSKSRYIRKVVLGELPQAPVPFQKADRQLQFKNGITQREMKKIFFREFPKVGNNLNQIARQLNSGQTLDNKMLQMVEDIRANHEKITRIIIKALR